MPGEIDLVTGKPIKNKERELLSALTPEEKAAQKAARAAEKEAKRAAKKSGKTKGAAADGDGAKADAVEDVSDAIAKLTAGGTREPELLSGQQMLAKQRAVTGVLASNPTSTDVKIEKLRKELKIHADVTYTPVVPGPEGEDDEPRIVDVTEGVSRSPSMRV